MNEIRAITDKFDNLSALARLAEELADWLVVQVSRHEHVSILGL
jgi:hypothetical protein